MPILGIIRKNYVQRLKDKSIDSAERDVVSLMAFGLGLSLADILLNQDKLISDTELSKLDDLINRRAAFEPVSKIIQKRFFWESTFYVDRQVLDPRPETELLIETVLENFDKSKNILDLGTGSGCIAISLALALSQVRIVGSDVSISALRIARQNAKLNNAQVNFICSDWFEDIVEKFDIIVSNPPYIKQDEFFNLPNDVKHFDPTIALVGGADGLDCYRKIAFSISLFLNDGGKGFFEIGLGQRNQVSSLFEAHGLSVFDVKNDLNGVERVVCVKKDA